MLLNSLRFKRACRGLLEIKIFDFNFAANANAGIQTDIDETIFYQLESGITGKYNIILFLVYKTNNFRDDFFLNEYFIIP